MNLKPIEQIVSPKQPHMVGDGFRVFNLIPGHSLSMNRMNPFIMLDYNAKHYFPPTIHQRGVGVHPHRGFETVTIAYSGAVAHHDSAGNSGVIHSGDVQWMTAGSGILHKEYHEKSFSEKGGDFQMVQLWVNLPAQHKMSLPKYQAISNSQIQKYIIPDNGGIIEVIAGQYKGVKGTANTFSDIHLLNIELLSNHQADFSFPAHHNTALLVISGTVQTNHQLVNENQLVVFANQNQDIEITAQSDSKILLLSAEPIHEPIVAHGPFVMNTRQEILEAFRDYEDGKFGILND